MWLLWIITSSLVAKSIFARPQQLLFENFVHYPGSSGKIIFPQDFEHVVSVASRINKVPTCENSKILLCENVDSYPYNYLKKVLEKNDALKTLFGEDEVPTNEVSKRLGEVDEHFVCRSMTKTFFPKAGLNRNNEWRYIINQGRQDGFVQGVQVEICAKPDDQCDFPGTPSLGTGYQTFCKQKFVYRRLLSLNDKSEPVTDTFRIPSACCCAYKQTFDFLSRLGRSITPAKKKNNQFK